MASKAMDLIYWRDLGRTGIVFTSLVVGLLCMFQCSAISVVSNLSLAILCFTLPVRLFHKALDLIYRRKGVHPFKSYLEQDPTLTDEQTACCVERIVLMMATAIMGIKHLFFIGNLSDSFKFILLMYLLSYVGVLCNGLTLLIIGVISMFSLPLFYRQHQERIYRNATAVKALTNKVRDSIHQVFQGAKMSPAPSPISVPKGKAKTK